MCHVCGRDFLVFCCVFDAAGPGKLACWWHVLLWALVAKS